MKIYKFKAYERAKDGVQDRLITRFGLVRNYAAKMMSMYYKVYGKTLTAYQLSNHIAKKKKRKKKKEKKMKKKNLIHSFRARERSERCSEGLSARVL